MLIKCRWCDEEVKVLPNCEPEKRLCKCGSSGEFFVIAVDGDCGQIGDKIKAPHNESEALKAALVYAVDFITSTISEHATVDEVKFALGEISKLEKGL
jgi:hypothetical protein